MPCQRVDAIPCCRLSRRARRARRLSGARAAAMPNQMEAQAWRDPRSQRPRPETTSAASVKLQRTARHPRAKVTGGSTSATGLSDGLPAYQALPPTARQARFCRCVQVSRRALPPASRTNRALGAGLGPASAAKAVGRDICSDWLADLSERRPMATKAGSLRTLGALGPQQGAQLRLSGHGSPEPDGARTR